MTQIKLTNNVRVSDPCYDNDVWCKTKLTDVLPGNYNVFVEKGDELGWGMRVKSVRVIHENFSDTDMWEEHSEIGVDSGQAGIFCETSYRNDTIAEGIVTPPSKFNLPGRDSEGDIWYEKMCNFTLSDDQSGVYDTGVVTSSGIGDGSYPLDIIRERNGYIVGMKITYLFDEEDEDEEDDYNDSLEQDEQRYEDSEK